MEFYTAIWIWITTYIIASSRTDATTASVIPGVAPHTRSAFAHHHHHTCKRSPSFLSQCHITVHLNAKAKKGQRGGKPPNITNLEIADIEGTNEDTFKTAKKAVRSAKKTQKAVQHFFREPSEKAVIVHPHYSTDCNTCYESGKPSKKKLTLTVHGNPIPLRRHRSSRGYMYNPSAPSQKEFQSVVKDILEASVVGRDRQDLASFSSSLTTSIKEEIIPSMVPFFEEHEPISMNIIFRLKRPKNHFIGNKPGHDRIRPIHQYDYLDDTDDTYSDCSKAPKIRRMYPSIRSDIDNLVKFVLDSMNGILYADDRQVVSLSSLKILDTDCTTTSDSDQMCDGSTTFTLEAFSELDIDEYLSSS